jgi:tetratricopeptide (TPR) repeat protein
MKVVKAYAEAFVRPSGAEKEARRRLVELYLAQGRHDAAEGLMNVQGEDAAAAAPHEKLAYICDAGLAILDQLPPKSRDALLEWLRRRRAVFADAGKEADYFGRALTLALRLDKKSDWAALAKDAAEAVAGARPPALAGQAAWLAARLAEAARAGWPGDEPWKLLEKTLTTAGAALPAAGQLALYGPVLDALGFPLKAGSAAAHTRDVLLARCLELFTAMVNPERDRGIAGLTDRLKTMGEMDRAMEMARRIENAAFSSWKIIELLQFERKFAEMAQACEELEKMDAGEFAARAQRARADAYRDHLARYEEAIKLYNMINDPPGTVWSIVDCYERWGKPEQAVASCSEIEGFFERDAPRAGLRKGEIWKRAGDDKRAIAEFRAVVKKYPRDQVSSTAHQILEQYGIKTGGGVVEE